MNWQLDMFDTVDPLIGVEVITCLAAAIDAAARCFALPAAVVAPESEARLPKQKTFAPSRLRQRAPREGPQFLSDFRDA
jgi:hypothetical protein